MLRTRSLIAALAALTTLAGAARADVIFINNGYYQQQTSVWCGPASMQMMLASAPVQALNPGVPSQAALYLASRPYNVSPMLGTDPIAFAVTMNLADGRFHNYAWYGFAPSAFGANVASRTIANALKDFGIPGTVAVNHGQHWIDVNGVTTTGTIGRNQPYRITGFFVRDPWPLRGTLGPHAWLAYNSRGRNIVNRPLWFRYFNPIPSPPVLPYTGRYVAVLEPVGPEQPDDGTNDSTPPPPPLLASNLTPAQAITTATNDLAADADLNGKFGFTNGGFDSNVADVLLLQFPDDPATDGDLLVPYDGPGGVNDVTGALLINIDTGTIDEALWIESGESPMTLARTQQIFEDQFSGNLDADDILATLLVPEPGSLLLFVTGMGFLIVWHRRRVRRGGPSC